MIAPSTPTAVDTAQITTAETEKKEGISEKDLIVDLAQGTVTIITDRDNHIQVAVDQDRGHRHALHRHQNIEKRGIGEALGMKEKRRIGTQSMINIEMR